MKILIATSYIYKQEWPEFTKNRTGFGIMVNDIFECISEDDEVYLISNVITKGHNKVLKHTWLDVFLNAKPRDWINGVRNFFKYKQGLKDRIRYFYYALNAGSIRKTLKQINTDLVYVHGIGEQIKSYFEACEEEEVPYIVTLHGLIGLDKSIKTSVWDKQMEKDFLISADRNGIPVSVISSGMKKRIEENYLYHEAKNISVVCNGTKIPYIKELINLENINLRSLYQITDEKIIVVIGTICDRNNQIQIVRAIENVKASCQVFFCGADAMNGLVQSEINKAGLSKKIHMLGFLSNEKVEQILEQADLNLVASKEEGYGVSIVDAYRFGVPTVIFEDLNVVSGLYNENAMLKIEDRSDEALVEGIEKGLNQQWNKEWIKTYAKGFCFDNVVDHYKAEYQQALIDGGYMSIAKTCDYISVQKRKGFKILSYIGNITENKNQFQLVMLMSELNEKNIIAVLTGREMDGGQTRKVVIDNNLSDSVIFAGFCSEMDSLWINVDANVLLSKNDGFGLSIIEGYMRGVPSVMNNELDAYEDVNVDNALIGVSISNMTDVKNAILASLRFTYNSKAISLSANAFSLKEMARLYKNIYTNYIFKFKDGCRL